jgi:hypothetical protein
MRKRNAAGWSDPVDGTFSLWVPTSNPTAAKALTVASTWCGLYITAL